MAERLSDRVRARLRDEMSRRAVSQRDLAGLLNTNQSRISKLLNGRTAMDVDDLEEVAVALGLAPTEAVRDQGLEFCSEMTPTELRLFQLLRKDLRLFALVLEMCEIRTKTNKPERHAGRLVDKKPTRR